MIPTANLPEAVIRTAAEAAAVWRRTPVHDRTAVLLRAAQIYGTRSEDLARTMAQEMGKPISQGREEIRSCIRILEYTANEADALLRGDTIASEPGSSARVALLPTGVVLGIMPWNYPHYQLIRLIAPNLLLGNGVLFKHARLCGSSALAVAEIFAAAGAPAGLVADSQFTHAQTGSAISHPAITGVSFTGGDTAGAAIARAAGGAVKKVVLELGGNDPVIVFDESRVDELARTLATARLSNAGQTCVSPKRIIVRADIMPQFVTRFSAQFLAATPGDPLLEETVLGPLATAGAGQSLREILRSAVANGIDVRGDSAELERTGRNFSPQLIVNPPRNHAVWTEELFGPVAILHSAVDVSEAISLANDSVYGLGATVYTSNVVEGERFLAELECGMISLNGPKGGSPAFPFGGVKRSGFGRELGSLGIREFANQQLIVEHHNARTDVSSGSSGRNSYGRSSSGRSSSAAPPDHMPH
ncbi:Aldehyde dehydrogenase [Leucobacter sp. 7(1)]|uniref:aldehyde dehydrogenase family protein n=1 Tax=Leucobacter sp. 7(1) TaxID=1255613 RepID=UPI00097F4A03|nr:aldehyde dehydrogenase family protein [Leucobacter sp. 7(1)]SJN11609.1 Aldehyde dehydrogenase [Leucobacter sp. 7(1)]